MVIVEISALENGAHRNQICNTLVVPSGWAVVKDVSKLQNFPFGSFQVEQVNGVTYVLDNSWTPLPIPEPEPEPIPEPEVEKDVWDELAQAYREGVQSAYDE